MTIGEIVKLAESGNAYAQNQLGLFYYENNDISNTLIWWQKAADGNCADAQYNLAMCYYDGFGVERNVELAKNLLIKASAKNHEPSIDALHRLFRIKVLNFFPDSDDSDFY